MFGYAGKILRINLTTREIVKDILPEKMCVEFIGGRGFVAKTLYEELPPGTHPFDENNLFIIATGPLSGHFLPASGKTHFGSKSPATGGYADSNMGGHFGPALKYAGYDMVVITGKAETPSFVFIEDDKIDIRPAAAYWGGQNTGWACARICSGNNQSPGAVCFPGLPGCHYRTITCQSSFHPPFWVNCIIPEHLF